MDATRSILLEPGFIVNSGTTFTAKIGGCSTIIIPNTGLVAHYRLRFYSPLSDETRFDNTGLLYNSSISAWNRRYEYFCHDFNGVTNNAYMLIPNQTQLTLGTNFTYSIWYNLKSYYGMDGYRQSVANGNHVLLAKEGDRGGFYVSISNDTQNDQQRITYANADVNGNQNFFLIGKPTGTATTNLNTWNYLVITFENSVMKMYINGAKIAEKTGIIPNFSAANTKNLNLGRMFALGSSWYPFNGAADDLKIFNRTLTDTEVLNLYNYEK